MKSLKSDNENEAVEIEEILEKTKWLGLSPWLVLALVAGAALLVLAMALSYGDQIYLFPFSNTRSWFKN